MQDVIDIEHKERKASVILESVETRDDGVPFYRIAKLRNGVIRNHTIRADRFIEDNKTGRLFRYKTMVVGKADGRKVLDSYRIVSVVDNNTQPLTLEELFEVSREKVALARESREAELV